MLQASRNKEAVSIAYQGNVVDLWERLAKDGIPVELGSDQTSLHNPYAGGYYPAGLTLEESNKMMAENPERFKEEVQKTLRRHVAAINQMTANGMYFWDYGNAFLLEASRAGADVMKDNRLFDIHHMWKTSWDHFLRLRIRTFPLDLYFRKNGGFGKIGCHRRTSVRRLSAEAPKEIKSQMEDNLHWIRRAGENKLVVGSLARILYADCDGRTQIAAAFNEAIRNGEISAPIVLGRDHHDVSGTDSPFRETSNIYDGSSFTADMAVHNVIGDAFRGATWVSLHNGGGVGWGEVINGGFGMLLDGSEECDRRLTQMLHWDVNNGISRRSWARNEPAIFAIKRAMEQNPNLKVTLPNIADDDIVAKQFKKQ